MNKRKIFEEIKQNFMLKRLRAQEECDDFIENLRKDKVFDELYSTKTQKELEVIKTELEEQKAQLKQEIDQLQRKIDLYLCDNHIEKLHMVPHYDCEKCQDTGIYDGKICKCLLDEFNKKLSLSSSSQVNFVNFDQSNEKILDDTDKKTISWLKTWCEKYPLVTKTNINIIGGSGCGKTFLLECMANELLNKNAVVCFKSAFELNELARLYHIGKSYDFADCLDADVLLIDDLGTEPILKNVTKEYLYNVINVRQINNKPTIISTNLSLENILDRYDERIFSRLGNKNLSINIQLSLKDKRIK